MKRSKPRKREAKTSEHVYLHFLSRMQWRFKKYVSKEEWELFNPQKTPMKLLFRESNSRSWWLANVPQLGFDGFVLYQAGLGATTVYTDELFKSNFPDVYEEILPLRLSAQVKAAVHKVLIEKGYSKA